MRLLNRIVNRAGLSLLVIFMLAGSCSEEEPGVESGGQDKGEPTASKGSGIVLDGIDGESVRFSDFRGKIVLLSFWATWKNDSEEFIAVMNSIHRKFKRNVEVISVAMDSGGAPVVRSYMRNVSITHRVFVNGEKIANRFGGARKLPTTYIILRDGKVFKRFNGLQRKQIYEDWLIRLLSHRM